MSREEDTKPRSIGRSIRRRSYAGPKRHRFSPPCPSCPPGSCSCPTAHEFAKARGVALPTEETGELCGGHLSDTTRLGARAQLERLKGRIEASADGRAYVEILAARLATLRVAARALAREELRVAMDLAVMRAVALGLTYEEIGEAMGHDKWWAIRRMKTLVRSGPAAWEPLDGFVSAVEVQEELQALCHRKKA